MILIFKRKGVPDFEDFYELDIKCHKMPTPTGDNVIIYAKGNEVDFLLEAIKKLQGKSN